MAACELTLKMEEYCRARAEGLSQRLAYRRAYNAENMKDETADKRAYELERKPKIAARISAMRKAVDDEALRRTAASAAEVLIEISDIAFGRKEFEALDADGQPCGVLPTISQRQKALDTLARHYGLLTDRVQVNCAVSAPDLSGLSIEELRALLGASDGRE